MVVPFAAFEAHGAIPRRSVRDGSPLHISAAGLPADARVVFFSQRWLRKANPDDEAGTKHKGALQAMRLWASHEGVAEANLYVWFDFCSVEQDDFVELVACINSLGLYIAASDAFVAIHHEEYWGRAWCLSEQMFGDATRVPRYLLTSGGELETVDSGAALSSKIIDPMAGELTVESDRPVIEVLVAIARNLRAQLYYGGVSQFWAEAILDHEIAEKATGGAEDVVAIHGIKTEP